jgi:hypothetical protein
MRDDSSHLHEHLEELKATFVFSMGHLKENLLADALNIKDLENNSGSNPLLQ